MAEVPKQLDIARELENAILRCGSPYPDIALAVNQDGLQRRGPDSKISWASPSVHHVAFLIQFDGFRSLCPPSPRAPAQRRHGNWLQFSASSTPATARAHIRCGERANQRFAAMEATQSEEIVQEHFSGSGPCRLLWGLVLQPRVPSSDDEPSLTIRKSDR
jgi:hypothetical protein